MKNKKMSLLVFGVVIFLSGLVFLMPVGVRADYAATVNYSCPSGGIISGSTCSYLATLSGGSSFNVPLYDYSKWDTTWGTGNFSVCNRTGIGVSMPPDGCPAGLYLPSALIGYASSSDISNSKTLFRSSVWQRTLPGCAYVIRSTYATSPTFANCASQKNYISSVSMPGVERALLGGYIASSAGIYGGTPTCKSSDTLSADKTTCTYTATASYSCPSGGTLSGTTCITDNGCAANTCTGQTCWNNLAWVPGTKICADNSCAANTCTTNVCWNNLAWIAGTKLCDNGCAANTCTTATCNNGIGIVQGTKICDNGCAAITCNTTTCWNNISWVTGTKICADNSCAANICGLPLPAEICWNNLAWIPGTKDCRIDNLCAASTCQTSNTTPPKPTTCDNGINPLTPGTKSPIFNKLCSSAPITCTENDCGKTIPTTTNPTCIMDDATDCMIDTACATPCPAPANQTCPPCPLTINGWREVAP